jgi:hypothetical protein
MHTDVYRYALDETIPSEEFEATFVLALFAVESIHGEAQTRLDVGHAFDAKKRTIVIDAGTPVGRDLNRVFIGLMTREFGTGSFRVERVQREPKARSEPVTA